MPFSGGRESSTWLAMATGYPAPRPRRPGPDNAAPSGMASPGQLRLQERVIAALGLGDWERIEPERPRPDRTGRRRALTRTGPLWPPNAYVMVPLLEAARDGMFVLLTGLGDFFSWWRRAPCGVVTWSRRPTKRDGELLGTMFVPPSVRARVARRRGRRRRFRGSAPGPNDSAWRFFRSWQALSPCDSTAR